jgi:hypothetical protein
MGNSVNDDGGGSKNKFSNSFVLQYCKYELPISASALDLLSEFSSESERYPTLRRRCRCIPLSAFRQEMRYLVINHLGLFETKGVCLAPIVVKFNYSYDCSSAVEVSLDCAPKWLENYVATTRHLCIGEALFFSKFGEQTQCLFKSFLLI